VEERYQLDLPALLEHLERASGLVLDAPVEVREPVEIGGKRVEAVEDLVLQPEMLENPELIKAFVTRIEDHRAELARVGEVNLGALDEYTELAARHDELSTQRTDLESSVAGIRAAIAKMNKTCRERFRETFDRVDEAFRKAYPELVGGGEARLELTDEDDLLETGVEVVVRPPGKRAQSLSLLSGGEKAMTAIALLLALFSVKPSPFCVLDEVDAPLDEANGARFNDMLRRMAEVTQFIVITHNRKTMECADTLYGVTMPTPGCSALVSVRVDD
jgi:chromosome segregation protein